jgi:ferric-dicitrate binding protein FerR (iron transport regulator)
MVFRGDPLSYVFRRLERAFNVEFNISSPDITDAPYRATFSNETLDEILRMLEMSAPIKFVYLNRNISAENHEKQRITVSKTTAH